MLPAFDTDLGAKPMFDKEQRAIRFKHPPHLA
jgi:hypothetical protein